MEQEERLRRSRERSREWRKKNPEKVRAAWLRWQEKNPETYKQARQDSWTRWKKDNPEKGRAYAARYNRKPEVKAARRMRYGKRRTFIDRIKLLFGCLNPACSCSRPLPAYCLDFHHINPHEKAFDIGTGCRYSLPTIVEEINKCTVLCAVCHRMETWGELDASTLRKCRIRLRQP